MKSLETLEKEHFRIEQLACEARDKYGIHSKAFSYYYHKMIDKEIEIQEYQGEENEDKSN